MFRILTKEGVGLCMRCALTLVVGLSVIACSGEEPDRVVDASVSVDLADSLPVGSPFDVGYTWTPGDDFVPPADDLKVFVHLADPDGNIVEQDDHYPPLPTSQWRAGEPVSYRRLYYTKPDLRPDYVDVYIGLYDDDGQVGTRFDGQIDTRPLVHTVAIRTDDQGGLPVYVEGFADRETSLTAEDDKTASWHWMRRRGVVAFGNPRGPSTLYLRALSPVDLLSGPQRVTITLGERPIAAFDVLDGAPFVHQFEIPGDDLGDGDWVDFAVEVSEIFVPAQADEGSTDTRELGLQVFWMYLAR